MTLTETPDKYILEGKKECPDCRGTGLYQGMGEKGGAYLICINCHGTGSVKVLVEYAKFKGRKREERCVRVYTKGMGYTISDKDIDIIRKFKDYEP